jgi:hypothetical protein
MTNFFVSVHGCTGPAVHARTVYRTHTVHAAPDLVLHAQKCPCTAVHADIGRTPETTLKTPLSLKHETRPGTITRRPSLATRQAQSHDPRAPCQLHQGDCYILRYSYDRAVARRARKRLHRRVLRAQSARCTSGPQADVRVENARRIRRPGVLIIFAIEVAGQPLHCLGIFRD